MRRVVQTGTASQRPGQVLKWLQEGFKQLSSVRFAATVVVLISIACGVGTVLPQGNEVATYTGRHPGASTRLNFYALVGVTHVFSSWWFIALLGVLAASVAACSARRFAAYRATRGPAQRRALGSMFVHLSILLILAGAVVRGVCAEKGYLEFREGETKTGFVTGTNVRPLPFALQLEKFEVETYEDAKPSVSSAAAGPSQSSSVGKLLVRWPEQNLETTMPLTMGGTLVVAPKDKPPTTENSFRIQVLRYVPDFTVDLQTHAVRTRSNEPRNPAVEVALIGPAYQNHRWLFARFPSFDLSSHDTQPAKPCPLQMRYEVPARSPTAVAGPIKSFKSTLGIVEGERVTRTTIEVNHPLTYKGYTFYQTGYNPQDLSWTSLQVVADPGVPVIYAGFGLMIVGLSIVFYLNPWLDARRRQS